MGVYSHKDENPSKFFFFHDPSYAQISDCYVVYLLLCYCYIIVGRSLFCILYPFRNLQHLSHNFQTFLWLGSDFHLAQHLCDVPTYSSFPESFKKKYHVHLYLRSQLTSRTCFLLIYPSIINRFPWNFVKIIFQQSPNIPDNFVKLYAVFLVLLVVVVSAHTMWHSCLLYRLIR